MVEWKASLLRPEATVQDAIFNLNATGLKIVLVVNHDGILLGTISDGDIRRGMLRGVAGGAGLDEILHRNPLVVPPEMSRDTVIQLMHMNKIQQVPVVDEGHRVVGLHLWDEVSVPQERTNIMVIMAGGLGTRLRPHTENCPKPLLRVAGKPMLEHIIERAHAEGFVHFIVALQYLGYMIEDYFGDGSKWRVKIEYLKEDKPLGTAGALSLLSPRPTSPFIVTNGDVMTDIRYGELLDFQRRHAAYATMAVRLHEWQHPYGVVQTKGVDIIGFEEKPLYKSHVNAGVYALDPVVLDELPKSERCDMPTLFERVKSRGFRTVAYPMHEPWLDVGAPDDLKRAGEETSPARN